MAGRKKAAPMVLTAGAKPQLRNPSRRDWTKKKGTVFLTTLAETCNVTRAAEAAGIALGTAYRRRKTDAAFRAAWLEALGTAYSRLELVLLDRAFNGTEKVLTRKDGSEERMLEYSNQLGLTLLRMHRDTAVTSAPENEPADIDEIRQRLFDKLERVRLRETAQCAPE